MDESVFFAQLLGPLFIVGGLGILMNMKKAKKMVGEMEKSFGLTFITAFFMIILAMAIVLSHNVWEWSWKVLITLMGWAILLKGASFMLIPDQFFKFGKKLAKKEGVYTVGGLIWILIGLCLTYNGFLA